MHADGPRAVGPHGKPVEASAGTTASDVGDIWKSVSKNLKFQNMAQKLRRRWTSCRNQVPWTSPTCTLVLMTQVSSATLSPREENYTGLTPSTRIPRSMI